MRNALLAVLCVLVGVCAVLLYRCLPKDPLPCQDTGAWDQGYQRGFDDGVLHQQKDELERLKRL